MARHVLAGASVSFQRAPAVAGVEFIAENGGDAGVRLTKGVRQMENSIGDLKRLREELAERRRKEVYWIHNAFNYERLEKTAQVELAIQAIDAVIAEGEPERVFTVDNV